MPSAETGPRFSSGGLPLAYRDQILRLPGVAKIGVVGSIPGAHQYYQLWQEEPAFLSSG